MDNLEGRNIVLYGIVISIILIAGVLSLRLHVLKLKPPQST